MKTTNRKSSVSARNVQATRIFHRALEAYNNGHKYYAMQTAKYALKVTRRTNEYAKTYICTFLAQLKFDLGQDRYAQLYCKQAIDALEKFHPEFKDDKSYLDTLLRTIEARLN